MASPSKNRWDYCEHPFNKLKFFADHYKCRQCGRSWAIPHILEARYKGARAIVRLEDLEIERAEVLRKA